LVLRRIVFSDDLQSNSVRDTAEAKSPPLFGPIVVYVIDGQKHWFRFTATSAPPPISGYHLVPHSMSVGAGSPRLKSPHLVGIGLLVAFSLCPSLLRVVRRPLSGAGVPFGPARSAGLLAFVVRLNTTPDTKALLVTSIECRL
jgi:hypothetical protein